MEGLGAAWNVANVTKGSTGVIFGLGTVGLSVSATNNSTGVLPSFVPFAQAFAVVLTVVLTGSLYYVAASPKDPTYTVAPVLQSRSGRQDLKKLFEGSITYPCSKALESSDCTVCFRFVTWYEKRQIKKIYSPLLEGLLALYLGFEWIQTNNILAPIITHGIYSTVILGHGLWKIHDHRVDYGKNPTAQIKRKIFQVDFELPSMADTG
ncbi:hypothetical protein Ahy_A04g019742 [Arachis hypogaea]|uniref:Uncharacterized protein n=1 Tax=Arachis hypogaea TaxID=3818 RepID=A0A445DGH2_ARAHY|nr:hypothetical protein Ahy_A04g019742 [Arachis hypogaea]